MTRVSSLIVAALLLTAPIHAAWRSEGPFLGAVVDVAIDSANPDIIYAATGSGGVWRSDDGGQHWMLPGDGLVSRKVVWIEVDRTNPSTIWAGLDTPGHTGLWRSPDRGKNWAAVHADKFSQVLGQPIAFAASNPSIIYAPSTNLHYRTADGGKTWESFRVPDQDAYAFAIDPKNPKIVYAGGRGSEHQLRRSSDGGKTWKPADAGLPDRSIKLMAIPRERPSTVYAMNASGQLFKTEDGAESWKQLGIEKLFSLDLDPNDALTLFAGTENGLYKTTDGGATWNEVGEGLGNWYCKGVAFDPRKKGTMYAGTTGMGFFKSTDGGKTFVPSSNGLGAGWPKKLWAPSAGDGPVFVELSVGLYRQESPGAWTRVQAPFAADDDATIGGVVFDRQSPKRLYVHDAGRWWRSEDAGRSWQEIEVPQPGVRDLMRGKIGGPAFQALAQDAADPKIFYAGGSWSKDAGEVPVNKSTNGGKKWDPAGAGISGNVTVLRAAAQGVVYAAADGVYRTSDGAKSWSLVRPGEVKDVAVDPSNPQRLFVLTKEGVYRSTDSGANWKKVSDGIKTEEEIEAVVVAPSGGKVFAGTFEGVFVSADGGDTWKAMNDGLTNTDVRALAISGGSTPRLYAGVAGGSVHSTELP